MDVLFGIAEMVGWTAIFSFSVGIGGGGFVIACSWKASVWEEYWRNAYFLRRTNLYFKNSSRISTSGSFVDYY